MNINLSNAVSLWDRSYVLTICITHRMEHPSIATNKSDVFIRDFVNVKAHYIVKVYNGIFAYGVICWIQIK